MENDRNKIGAMTKTEGIPKLAEIFSSIYRRRRLKIDAYIAQRSPGPESPNVIRIYSENPYIRSVRSTRWVGKRSEHIFKKPQGNRVRVQ